MEYKIIQIEPSVREVEITFSAEELKPRYDAAYKKILPSVEIKGFRKGKVPLPMVKKMFGASIEAEVNEEMVNEFLAKEFRQTNIHLIDSPALTKMDKNKDGSVVCVLKIDAFDELTLKEYKGLQIQEPVYNVEDDKIEIELAWIARENGEKIDAEEITDDDFVITYDYSHQGADNPEPHYHENTAKLYAPAFPMQLKQNFINKKVGDKFFVDDKNEAGEAIQTEIIIKNIQKVIPAEYTSEFIGKITEGKLDTIEDFREEISFKLQEIYDSKSREYMIDQLLRQLNDLHSDYAIPKAIVEAEVKNQAKRMLENYKLPDNFLDTLMTQMPPEAYIDSERTIRIEYLITKIAEAENLQIEDYDIEPFIQSELGRNPSLSPNWVKEKLLENEHFVTSVLKKKVIDLLLDFAETTEVPFEEYASNNKNPNLYEDLVDDYDDEDYDDDDELDDFEYLPDDIEEEVSTESDEVTKD